MTKVYELKSLSAGVFQTEWLGTKVNLNFRLGKGSYGENHAELITSNPFVMDAIENDPRFGKVFILTATYDNEVTARNEHQQLGRVSVEGKRPSREELFEQKSITITEEKPKKTSKKKASKPAEEPSLDLEAEVKNDLEFSNVNEAMRFLLEKGETVTEENLQSLLNKYGATIKD